MPAAMRFKVRPLRIRGRRLPWREIENGPAFVGDLNTYEMHSKHGVVKAATLTNPGNQVAPRLLPDLYEPVLLGFAPLAFQLRGFERHEGPDGGFSTIQEWHCELP